MHRRLLLCLLLITISSAAGANDLAAVDSALMRGNYTKAVDILSALVADGNPTAMVQLASLYQRGEGVARNAEKAVRLYLSAAELGDPEAQFNLGNMYLLGEGVPQDEDWALSFYRLAAAQGHVLATQNMRELYRSNGVDPAIASTADAVPGADAIAAPLQAAGTEAPTRETPAADAASPDLTIADPAAITSPATAAIAEPVIAADPSGNDASNDATSEIPSSIQAASAVQIPSTTELEDIADASPQAGVDDRDDATAEDAAMVTLEPVESPVETPATSLTPDEAEAIRIAESHGIEVDIAEATSSRRKSTQVSRTTTAAAVASQATRREAAERALALENYEHAIKRLNDLVAEGDGAAAWRLARLYDDGEGVPQDHEQAMLWRERAAKLGFVEAQFDLGERYATGRGVMVDEAMAITYYRDAARGGHPGAREHLREFYAAAGLPMPELTRPRTPIAITAPHTVPTDVDESGGGIDAAMPRISNPDPIETGILPAQPEDVVPRVEPLAMADTDAAETVADDEPEADNNSSGDAGLTRDAVAAPEVIAPTSRDASESAAVLAAPTTVTVVQPRLRPDEIIVHPDRVVTEPGGVADMSPAPPANHEVVPGSVLAVSVAPPVAEVTVETEVTEGATAPDLIVIDVADLVEGESDIAALQSVSEVSEVSRTVPLATERAARAGFAEPADAGEIASSLSITDDSTVAVTAPAASTQAADVVVASGSATAVAATTSTAAVAADTGGGFFRRLTGLFRRDPEPPAASQAQPQSPGAVGGEPARAPDSSRVVEDAESGTRETTSPAPHAAVTVQTLPEAMESEATAAPAVSQVVADPVMAMNDAPDEPGFSAADEGNRLPEPPAVPATEPTVADGKRALAAGDFSTALSIFTRLGEAGDPQAQAHIGYMYYVGEGVETDLARAVEWYRLAAVQGNRDAQYNLAVAYAFGEGVAQDDAMAVTWYRRAAEQGSAIAQYSLGMSYALGDGVAQDDGTAIRWYLAAAEQGYAAAQYNLGYSYRTGHGVEPDEAEALRWFEAAAANGHASAQYSLGYMYRSGRGVERNVDEAIKWYRLAAAQGHLDARADLASLNPGG